MDVGAERFLVLADSTRHGFGACGIFGDGRVFVVSSGGSLLVARKGVVRSSILELLVYNWGSVQQKLGVEQLELGVEVAVVPGRDSVNDWYDRLGELRDHFGILEAGRTINSYGDSIDGMSLYGNSGTKRLHFI